MLGQKTLHWQLNKVIPTGMYNCNFEAIKQGLKRENEKSRWNMSHSFTQLSSLMFWIRFRKVCYVSYVSFKNLLRLLVTFIAATVFRYNNNLKYEPNIFSCC